MIKLLLIKPRFTTMATKAKRFRRAIMTVINSGGASIVYSNPDDKKSLIKKARPNKRNSKGRYIARQKRGFDIIDKIKETAKDYGVNLPEFISSVKSIDIDTNETPYQSVVETKLPGIELNNLKYSHLDNYVKNKLALQLAKFMTVIHGLTIPEPATTENRIQDNLYILPNISIKNIFKFTEYFKNKKLKQLLNYAYTALYEKIGPDEIMVTTHGDLRWQNILYDKRHEKLGIIDFETAAQSHIYRDFISCPASFNWDFVQRIIKQYNKIRKNNNNSIYINAERIKKLLLCNIMIIATQDIIESENEDEYIDSEAYLNKFINKLEKILITKLKNTGLLTITNPVLSQNKHMERN